MGDTYMLKEEWETAIPYLEKCESKSQLVQHGIMEAWSQFNMAECMVELKKPEEALEECKKAIDTLERMEDMVGLGCALMVMGKIYSSLGYWDKANEVFERSLKIYEEYSSNLYIGMLFFEWGKMFDNKGEPAKSLETLQKAKKCFLDIGAMNYLDKVEKELKAVA